MPQNPETAINPVSPDQQKLDIKLIDANNARIGLNPVGGGVSSWQVKNPDGFYVDTLHHVDNPKRSGIPPCIPFYGEFNGLPKHGLRDKALWECSVEGNKGVMILDSNNLPPDAKAILPQPCVVRTTVEAEEGNSMVYTMDVLNKGDGVLDWGPALHTMLAINHADKPNIKTKGLDGFNAANEHWDTDPPDKPFKFNGIIEIELADKIVTIEEITDGQHVVENSVVWAPDPNDPKELENRDAVGFEQVCGVVNKDDRLERATSIPPGGEWHMKLRYTTKFKPKPDITEDSS